MRTGWLYIFSCVLRTYPQLYYTGVTSSHTNRLAVGFVCVSTISIQSVSTFEFFSSVYCWAFSRCLSVCCTRTNSTRQACKLKLHSSAHLHPITTQRAWSILTIRASWALLQKSARNLLSHAWCRGGLHTLQMCKDLNCVGEQYFNPKSTWEKNKSDWSEIMSYYVH